jgi:hypothetical protein
MNAHAKTRRKLAGAVVAVAAAAALVAPTALADPPNYPRHLVQSQTGLIHEPEILGGLAASAEGRPAPHPEIVDGILSPGAHVVASPVTGAPSAHVGFQWADAGIGAGVALAGAVLAIGCALAVRRRVSPAH